MKTHKLLRENWYRDLWLFAVTALVLVALSAEHKHTNEIQQGRRTTSGISCAVSAAVVKAGRVIITSSSKQGLPPKLEVFLEQHGLPPKKVREQNAVKAAQGYSAGINAEIVKVSGVDPLDVLNKDGTLNCDKLRALAKLK
jgi:hypothetical protein